jgi:hypothetical protein
MNGQLSQLIRQFPARYIGDFHVVLMRIFVNTPFTPACPPNLSVESNGLVLSGSIDFIGN